MLRPLVAQQPELADRCVSRHAPRVVTMHDKPSQIMRSGNGTFRVDGKLADYPTTFYRRDLLPVGERVPGPAIIAEDETSTIVGANFTASVNSLGYIVLERRR
mgnify:CR=1 FL=1